LAAAGGDRLAFTRISREPADFGEQLVAAHADQRPDARELHVPAALGERFDPRLRMGVVAVDERSVDVEDDGAVHLRAAPSLAGLVARNRLDLGVGRPPRLIRFAPGRRTVLACYLDIAGRSAFAADIGLGRVDLDVDLVIRWTHRPL